MAHEVQTDAAVSRTALRRTLSPRLLVVLVVMAGVALLILRAGSGSNGTIAGHEPSPAPIRAPIDPCTLITGAEAATIFGPVAEPAEETGMGVVPGQRTCVIRNSNSMPVAVIGLGALRDATSSDDGASGPRSVAAVWKPEFRLLTAPWGEWAITIQVLVLDRSDAELRTMASNLAARIETRPVLAPPDGDAEGKHE